MDNLGTKENSGSFDHSGIRVKMHVKFYHDSIAKHINVNKLVSRFKVDTAEKETSYTLKELRKKAASSDTVHTFITHIEINDIVNLDKDANDLVKETDTSGCILMINLYISHRLFYAQTRIFLVLSGVLIIHL